jgi:hypothetical protein
MRTFREICVDSGTDKCLHTVHNDHRYHHVYPKYLESFRTRPIKLLEIGLGCGTVTGPGKSIGLWKEYLPHVELWVAEIDVACAEKFNASLDYRILVGRQGDNATLESWLQISGGGFDAIIDDGSHETVDQLASFHVLFPRALKPGGHYFIEDLQYQRDYERHHSAMLETMREWLLDLTTHGYGWHGSLRQRSKLAKVQAFEPKARAPADLVSIDCFRDMCVLTKASEE